MVSRDGITMTGVEDWEGEMDGRLRLLVVMTGLAPDEAISLTATGDHIVDWICGSEPEPCGEIGCAPAFIATTKGTISVGVSAYAGSDGAAAFPIEFVATPPAESCPAGASAPWGTMSQQWENVRITDQRSGLLLTPDTIGHADTY